MSFFKIHVGDEDDKALMSAIGGTIKGGVSMAPSLADSTKDGH